jgi:CRP/FNR family transcriptional regulator, cyclic AMP receptor protein
MLDFKNLLGDCIRRQKTDCPVIKVGRHSNVYTVGEIDRFVYYIESGQIKLMLTSSSGKECLLAIYTTGDIFGEICLAGIERRQGTATAMEDTVLKRMPCERSEGLVEGLTRYLVGRVADQQEMIADLVTVDSEHRLGSTLLRLAAKFGKHDPRSMRIEQRISHQELSEMVGTTRPRVSKFMSKFRDLGLVEINAAHQLIVKQKKLRDYLDSVCGQGIRHDVTQYRLIRLR